MQTFLIISVNCGCSVEKKPNQNRRLFFFFLYLESRKKSGFIANILQRSGEIARSKTSTYLT